MSALQFGTGWRDRHGRARTLIWLSDVGWALFDNGYDVDVFRRGIYDEVALRCRLLGWEDHVDEPSGADWATERLWHWEPTVASQTCLICQGEGWVAGPEGMAVLCACGTLSL